MSEGQLLKESLIVRELFKEKCSFFGKLIDSYLYLEKEVCLFICYIFGKKTIHN